MRERVSVIHGTKPFLLVAPHGSDDTHTDVIVEQAAKLCGCYAVINRGFDRSDEVDVNNDRADCNRIDHVQQEVVYEEFLKPIEKIVDKMVLNYSGTTFTGLSGWKSASRDADDHTPTILYIHGCGNAVHREAGESVQVIIGYGLGKEKHRLSCDDWRKNLMIHLFHLLGSGAVYEGKGGGKYAGRDRNNMNQYFKYARFYATQCMQLEFPYSVRDTETKAATTGALLATIVAQYLTYDEFEGSELFAKFI